MPALPRLALRPGRHRHRPDDPPLMFAALRRWDDFLAASGRAEDTRRSYRYHLLRFFADTLIDPAEVTEDTITAYLVSIRQKGQTVQFMLRALKSYYGWAERRGVHPCNPASEIRFKRPKYPPAVALDEEEFTRVVIAAAVRHPKRAWAIILTLETGGRIGSVAAVRPDDAASEAGELLRFHKAKGDRPYAVPLSPLAAEAVRELRAWSNGTLIGVTKQTIWSWYHRAAIDADLPLGKRHPHVLRDTFATNLLVKGWDVRVVQELLNHADLSQMHRYAAVTDKRKRAALASPSFGRDRLDFGV